MDKIRDGAFPRPTYDFLARDADHARGFLRDLKLTFEGPGWYGNGERTVLVALVDDQLRVTMFAADPRPHLMEALKLPDYTGAQVPLSPAVRDNWAELRAACVSVTTKIEGGIGIDLPPLDPPETINERSTCGGAHHHFGDWIFHPLSADMWERFEDTAEDTPMRVLELNDGSRMLVTLDPIFTLIKSIFIGRPDGPSAALSDELVH